MTLLHHLDQQCCHPHAAPGPLKCHKHLLDERLRHLIDGLLGCHWSCLQNLKDGPIPFNFLGLRLLKFLVSSLELISGWDWQWIFREVERHTKIWFGEARCRIDEVLLNSQKVLSLTWLEGGQEEWKKSGIRDIRGWYCQQGCLLLLPHLVHHHFRGKVRVCHTFVMFGMERCIEYWPWFSSNRSRFSSQMLPVSLRRLFVFFSLTRLASARAMTTCSCSSLPSFSDIEEDDGEPKVGTATEPWTR